MFNLFDKFNSEICDVCNTFSPELKSVVVDPDYVHTDNNLTDAMYQMLSNRKFHSFCYWLFGQEDDFFKKYFEEHQYNFERLQEEIQALRDRIATLPDDNYIVYNEEEKLTLDTDYLVSQQIIQPKDSPKILEFELTPPAHYIQPGIAQTYTGIIHQEGNYDKITSLTLYKNGEVLEDNISPSNTPATHELAEELTLFTNKKESFKFLLETTWEGVKIQKELFVHSKFLSYFGTYEEDTINVEQIPELLNGLSISESISGTEQVFEIEDTPKFVYVLVPYGEYIGNLTLDTFIVPMEPRRILEGEMNGIPCKYNCYRSSERLTPGTYNIKVG